MIDQKLQGLEVGYRMIQPGTVQTAVQQKPTIAQVQAVANCQHGIGIVLFHRKALRGGRHVTKRIKIPKDPVGLQPQLLHMDQTAVGG